jgi:hypothetical protein
LAQLEGARHAAYKKRAYSRDGLMTAQAQDVAGRIERRAAVFRCHQADGLVFALSGTSLSALLTW